MIIWILCALIFAYYESGIISTVIFNEAKKKLGRRRSELTKYYKGYTTEVSIEINQYKGIFTFKDQQPVLVMIVFGAAIFPFIGAFFTLLLFLSIQFVVKHTIDPSFGVMPANTGYVTLGAFALVGLASGWASFITYQESLKDQIREFELAEFKKKQDATLLAAWEGMGSPDTTKLTKDQIKAFRKILGK
jgi:hypothetical protein